ncbi:Ger(x)C family spore germination protein [Anaerobacillus alkaliphilus]|uniref:Ger(X)C family spore germination protein n=1 Tax=Anaerobacillus alkaliphilus TaxID=1548597 RepID=A0A4Q0VU63_9BACI|nr:Ger(x)C family spore germination protein [Anaerobacillus alkaliphilus]RXI99837.1 Ger(x)C family spore germination protein [Anaerobacillus alkaliphilus]
MKWYLVLLSILLLLTGCWDSEELNEISLVTGIAIDKGENYKYKLTVEVLNPPALQTENVGDQSASIIFSLEGDSVGELARKMNIGFTRKLKYSHMRIAVFSKQIVEEGMLEFIDFFEADREIRNDFNVLVVDNVQAHDVLKVTYPIQRSSSLKINTQADTMVQEWGGDVDNRLKDLIRALSSTGREPVLTMYKVEGEVEKGNRLENMEKVEIDTIVVIEGLAIFEKLEYKGTLPIKDIRNFLLLQDKLNNTSITAACANDKVMTARITSSKRKIKAAYKQDIPHINIDIDLEGRMDLIQCSVDVTMLDTYLDIENKIAKAFEGEIEQTIEVLQNEYQLDIFGFGEDMERQDYKNFKKNEDNWNQEFARAKINVDVKLKIRRSGLITNPVFEYIE